MASAMFFVDQYLWKGLHVGMVLVGIPGRSLDLIALLGLGFRVWRILRLRTGVDLPSQKSFQVVFLYKTLDPKP